MLFYLFHEVEAGLSLSKKNVLSAMTMTLTMISLISPADAQTTCSSTSPDCCWVVQSWEMMGKTTTVDRNSATACCSIFIRSPSPLSPYFPAGSTTQTGGVPWVYCTSDGTVIQLKWSFQGLKNSIPSELKNLRSLRDLRLAYNGLTGSIPPEIGTLPKLQWLYLHNEQNRGQLSGSIPSSLGNLASLQRLYLSGNPSLSETFTPLCGTEVFILRTSVTICGCATTSNPAARLSPFGTADTCLSSDPSTTLSKRTINFAIVTEGRSYIFAGRPYTCDTDSNKNPFADCLSSLTKICNPNDPIWNKANCKTVVDAMFKLMSPHWQAVRRECGQWQWTDGFTGSHSSEACATANKNLIERTFYIQKDGTAIKVDEGMTNSMRLQLWSNPLLA